MSGRWEIPHGERVAQKQARLSMLNVLLDAHEAFEYEDQDRKYIRELKSRISKTRAELRNMGTCLLSDE